ncbi:hypothetical protein Osc7112_4865 [Oscillatoria nigro-viridis PCC 7112]|uniref:Uncharacterized protein n=1 Tax=Phormidium nigroviride PCC 7112 TaxID=179408 RepID=K9VM10_9CYAN|nr:hypothetical protein [Oscillatoria nigro-viridis]AFZ09133.1 hypothetical protein Osc7112_4865 [Oscillatoria nigro-viridis PCC 7112]
MNHLELEQEIGKMARAMMTRNSLIGKDLIADLRGRLSVDSLAALMIVSIERLIWHDCESVIWSLSYLIPADVMEEIRRITALIVCQRLMGQGFLLGKDFSIDATGQLLLSDRAKTAVVVA